MEPSQPPTHNNRTDVNVELFEILNGIGTERVFPKLANHASRSSQLRGHDTLVGALATKAGLHVDVHATPSPRQGGGQWVPVILALVRVLDRQEGSPSKHLKVGSIEGFTGHRHSWHVGHEICVRYNTD